MNRRVTWRERALDDLATVACQDRRILFTFEDGGQVVLVLRVLNRRDAYR
ncbi:MAG: hypothetical protein M3N47_04370 [Chloroflexota bacterium]|nr:hypothetical protein [Chloroflexota bacterium]